MGVSVTSGVMAGTGRRGGYSRPYRLSRTGPAPEKPRPGQRQPDDTNSDSSSEELHYGPGIVSRLKNRYITIAMRESAGRRPPLRRVTSLEDLLDKDSTFSSGRKRDGHMLDGRAGGKRMDSMKRAKSVGDLASARVAAPDGGTAAGGGGRKDVPPIATEKVVLVEQTGARPSGPVPTSQTASQRVVSRPAEPPTDKDSSRTAAMPDAVPEAAETLPAPDTVRTVKRLFEPSRRPASSRPAAGDARVGASQRMTAPPERPRAARPDPGRRVSPVVRPPAAPSRPTAAKPAQLASPKHAGRPSPPAVSRSPVVKPFGTSPVTSFTSLPKGPTLLASGRRSLTASSLPSEVHSRAERTWAQQRQQEGTDHTDGDASRPASLPSSPSRAGKKLLSRESSLEPASPTAAGIRRQVGIIKPTRKVEHKDEFNRRKNALNHVRNSVVEKEIAVIGTEYLKRKQEAREISNKPAPLTSPTEAVAPVVTSQEENDIPAPALPPRKALVVEPEKPLTIDTTPPPRPAPFRGIVLKPVPKAEFTRPPGREGRPVSPPPPPPVATNAVRTSSTSVSSASAHSAEPPKPATGVISSVSRASAAVTPAPARLQASGGPSEPQPAAPPGWVVQPAAGAGKQKWHQAPDTSMVFNFTKRQEVPDYVEDDGLILRRRLPKAGDTGYVILPGFDPGQSCDDDVTSSLVSGPPSPCNVVFLNADVLINGKSSLVKKPKHRKMTVSFALSGPSTHEYPSEVSLGLGDNSTATSLSNPSTAASAPGGTLGGLATYTPSKLSPGEDFELGVSRLSAPAPAPGPPPERLSPDEFLKPADDAETVAWSCDTSSDMLF